MVALAVLCAALSIPPVRSEEPSALAMVQVARGVFVHQGRHELMSPENEGAIANIGFVVGKDAVAVIDTGGSLRVGLALAAAIRQATSVPVRYVINTHMHPDHVFGNSAFRHGGATFAGHHKLPRALAARARHYLEANRILLGEEVFRGIEIIEPSMLIDGETRIDLGGRTLILKAWPVAHTDNDLTVHDEATGTLFAGDLVFIEHLPVIDGSLKGWLSVMDELSRTPAARVVPGHGPVPAAWPGALDGQRHYLQHLATEIRAIIARGGTLVEAAETAGRSERGNWQLFDDFNARNATAAFAELEWE